MFRRRDFTYKPSRGGLRVRFSIHASGWQVFQQDGVARSKDRPLSRLGHELLSPFCSAFSFGNSTFFRRSRQTRKRIVHFTLYLPIFSLCLFIYLINIYILIYFFRENNYSKSEIKNTKFQQDSSILNILQVS